MDGPDLGLKRPRPSLRRDAFALDHLDVGVDGQRRQPVDLAARQQRQRLDEDHLVGNRVARQQLEAAPADSVRPGILASARTFLALIVTETELRKLNWFLTRSWFVRPPSVLPADWNASAASEVLPSLWMMTWTYAFGVVYAFASSSGSRYEAACP